MKTLFSTLLTLILTVFIFSSCSSKEKEAQKRIEYTKIVENRSAQDLLNDLYIGCDDDIQALCRILNTTPSVVDRIRHGKTLATSKFEERIKEVAAYYMINDQTFSRVRTVLDPEYGWYDYILDLPSNHPYWFWGILIVCLIILIVFMLIDLIFWIAGFGITLIVYLVALIASLICAPSNIEDKYINTINPVMEQII